MRSKHRSDRMTSGPLISLLCCRYEQEFVYHLLLHLKCNEIDPDYVPTHGHGAIASQPQPRVSKSRNRR